MIDQHWTTCIFCLGDHVSAILSDPLCKDDNTLTVPLKPLSDQQCGK